MSAVDTDNSTAVLEPAPAQRGRAAVAAAEETPDVDLMDPAQKALVEALRITYLLVKVAMVALVILFLTSGFQRVNTGESGISLRFGDITDTDLAPGLHGSWPYPVGELVRISTAPGEAAIEFLPELSDAERRDLRERGPTALAGGGLPQLGVQDSYLLTADQAMAHAQWQLRWRRANPAMTVRHIDDGDLEQIVQGVVRSSIVQAAASHTIDEILRSTPEPWRDPDTYEPLPEAARRLAQQKLDAMDSGVQISQLSLSSRFAPRRVIGDFDSVSKAEQEAAKDIAGAMTERERRLTEAAGGASETILAQIEQYERDLAAENEQAAQETYARIAALLTGEPVTIDGQEVTHPVSGRVASVMQEAEEFKAQIVSNAQTDAAIFEAKLAAFKANPAVMIHTDWANAFNAVLSQPNVQAMVMDTKGEILFQLNRDPDIDRRQQQRANQQKKARALEEREEEFERQRYERDTSPSFKEE